MNNTHGWPLKVDKGGRCWLVLISPCWFEVLCLDALSLIGPFPRQKTLICRNLICAQIIRVLLVDVFGERNSPLLKKILFLFRTVVRISDWAEGEKVNIDSSIYLLTEPIALKQDVYALISSVERPGPFKGIGLVDGQAEPISSTPKTEFVLYF